jgi:hypothetical protein
MESGFVIPNKRAYSSTSTSIIRIVLSLSQLALFQFESRDLPACVFTVSHSGPLDNGDTRQRGCRCRPASSTRQGTRACVTAAQSGRKAFCRCCDGSRRHCRLWLVGRTADCRTRTPVQPASLQVCTHPPFPPLPPSSTGSPLLAAPSLPARQQGSLSPHAPTRVVDQVWRAYVRRGQRRPRPGFVPS